jgi:predicted TIM-barrel fold metal-dependent hydrolase
MVSVLEARSDPPLIVRRDGKRFVQYASGTGYPLVEEMVDVDRKLAAMDEGGVGYSVLSVNIPGLDWFDRAEAGAIARAVNDELVDIVHGHPDRFGAFAALPLQAPDAAVAELERAVGQGLHGTMLYSNVAGRPLDEPEFRPVFEVAAELDTAILLHPTLPLSAPSLAAYALVPVIGFLFDTATATLRLILDGIFERHPDLKLILGHLGSVLPYVIGRIDYESMRLPGGTGALSGPPSEQIRRLRIDTVSNWPPAIRLAIDFFGAERILFATDHPFWEMRLAHRALDELDLTPGQRESIESANAVALLGLSDDASGPTGS